jgi:hypothetical protein
VPVFVRRQQRAASDADGAIVFAITVSPYVRDSGETLRWVLQIDGKEPSDLDIRTEERPERPDQISMFLVRGDEELEVGRWPAKRYPEGALVNWTLGGLRRFDADRFWGP